MKASEIITELQKLIQKHGDLESYRLDDYDNCEQINFVSFMPEDDVVYEDVEPAPIFVFN